MEFPLNIETYSSFLKQIDIFKLEGEELDAKLSQAKNFESKAVAAFREAEASLELSERKKCKALLSHSEWISKINTQKDIYNKLKMEYMSVLDEIARLQVYCDILKSEYSTIPKDTEITTNMEESPTNQSQSTELVSIKSKLQEQILARSDSTKLFIDMETKIARAKEEISELQKKIDEMPIQCVDIGKKTQKDILTSRLQELRKEHSSLQIAISKAEAKMLGLELRS